ncbi:MAG: hypothetical protein E7256_12870 [Lachnospiraceae bacterium]|nr:hypothetical protein [Lachnospiraceae bacterium]
MKKKADFDYFRLFSAISQAESIAAHELTNIAEEYAITRIDRCKCRVNEQKNKVNERKNQIIMSLWQDFLPPMNRGDLVEYTQKLGEAGILLSKVVTMMEMYPVPYLKGDIKNAVQAIEEAMKVNEQIIRELPNYKKSKVLGKNICCCRKWIDEGVAAYHHSLRQVTRHAEVTKDFFSWIRIYDSINEVLCCLKDMIDLTERMIYRNL